MKQQNDAPIAIPLLQTKYEGAPKDTMVKTNFQEVVDNLKQIISGCSTPDKPALVVESFAFDYKGLDPYEHVMVRINIIPGNKVDLYFKDEPVRKAAEEKWQKSLRKAQGKPS